MQCSVFVQIPKCFYAKALTSLFVGDLNTLWAGQKASIDCTVAGLPESSKGHAVEKAGVIGMCVGALATQINEISSQSKLYLSASRLQMNISGYSMFARQV